MKEEIKKTIIKYRESLPKNIHGRELKIQEMKFDKAIVIVGPRRAGKSYFLYNLAKKEDDPIMINFEDALISSIKKDNLNEIVECSKELFGIKKFVFYFDEIQNVIGWENFIISLLNEHYKVYESFLTIPLSISSISPSSNILVAYLVPIMHGF